MIALLVALALTGAAPKKAAQPAAAQAIQPLATADEVLALPAFHAPGVHVIHFWASWCGPCREELPDFLARARALAKRGVDFTFVSADAPADVEHEVRPLLSRLGGFFPGAHHVVMSEEIDPGALTPKLDPEWEGGIPVTFVFQDGKMIGSYRGAREREALEHLPLPKGR